MLAIFISLFAPLTDINVSILGTVRKLAVCVPLQLPRQIFFTNCILTDGSAPCRLRRVLHPGPASLPHGAHQLFPTNRALTDSWASVLRRAIGHGTSRNPGRAPITAFLASIGNGRYLAYCAPHNSVSAFSYRSHFDWTHKFPPLQRRYCWTYVRHNQSVAVRFDSGEISHYKCPL